MKHAAKLLRLAIRLLGPALLIFFLVTVDLGALWSTLLQADLWLVLCSILLVVPFLLLKAIRWRRILWSWRIPLRMDEAVAQYSVGMFLGLVTPGQAGDTVKAWYLRERGYPLSVGLAGVVVDRLFDLGITTLVATTALYFFRDLLPNGALITALIIVGVLGAVGLGFLLLSHEGLRRYMLEQVVPRITPRGLRERLPTAALAGLSLSPPELVTIALISGAGLIWTYIRAYLIFLALDTPLPIGPFIALIAVLAIVSPLSPGGVGTRDALLVLVLTAFLQLSTDDAIVRALALSTLLLVLNLVNVLIGFIFSLYYPITPQVDPALAEPTQS